MLQIYANLEAPFDLTSDFEHQVSWAINSEDMRYKLTAYNPGKYQNKSKKKPNQFKIL